jgi:hypothetical protein
MDVFRSPLTLPLTRTPVGSLPSGQHATLQSPFRDTASEATPDRPRLTLETGSGIDWAAVSEVAPAKTIPTKIVVLKYNPVRFAEFFADRAPASPVRSLNPVKRRRTTALAKSRVGGRRKSAIPRPAREESIESDTDYGLFRPAKPRGKAPKKPAARKATHNRAGARSASNNSDYQKFGPSDPPFDEQLGPATPAQAHGQVSSDPEEEYLIPPSSVSPPAEVKNFMTKVRAISAAGPQAQQASKSPAVLSQCCLTDGSPKDAKEGSH